MKRVTLAIVTVIQLCFSCYQNAHAFQTSNPVRQKTNAPGHSRKHPVSISSFMAKDDDKEEEVNQPSSSSTSIPPVISNFVTRITKPRIDDRGLPYNDAAIAQIVGPSLQVFWLTSVGARYPGWLKPIFGGNALWQLRGSLVAPTLIHGAGLAVCWLLGALAAEAYEQKAIDPTVEGYSTVVWKVFQAGCFASGLLILATQADLFIEFGGKFVPFGTSEETDVRILTAWIEVLNDIVFEILAIVPTRLYLAYSIEKNTPR